LISQQIQKLFGYNEWAWQRVFPSLVHLDDTEYRKERPQFWGSLHSGLVHCLAAETIWLLRVQGQSPTTVLQPEAFPDLAAVRQQWVARNQEWQAMAGRLTDEELGRVIEYRNTRGNGFSMALVDIMQHVVNHSTEHRSQMTPILHQLGVPTPPLDYMVFCVRE
jgi:uncharacterized damage-inducible protein DinB